MAFLLETLPRDDDELYWFVRLRFGVAVPRTKVCADHVAPFTAFADAFFAKNSLDPEGEATIALWHGSRGLSGKSFALSLLAITMAELLGSDVNLLGGSLAQSMNIHEHIGKALRHENAPEYMVVKSSSTRITLTNGATIVPLTASQKTVRGPHPPRLLCDEIDEMEEKILRAALGQPLPQDSYLNRTIEPYTVLCSTWQNVQGTFASILKEAEGKNWPIYRWCVGKGSLILTARGEVPIEEVTDTDLVLTRKGWRHVQHVTLMGYKPTIALNVGNRQLRLTADHRVATRAGWLAAGALAAHPMATTGPNPGVLESELVTAGAMSGPLLEPPRSSLVLGGRDDVEMLNVDTGTIATEVIGLVSVGDWADDIDPDPKSGIRARLAAIRFASGLDPVPGAFSPRPIDAVSGEHGNSLEAVYDIGVEGEHEFIAEGVVVHNCYRESANEIDGWLSEETIKKKKNDISQTMWDTEYELNEPSGGMSAFNKDAVEAMFGLPFEPIAKKEAKDFEEYLFQKPTRHGDYVVAADWGKRMDYTVIVVMRVDRFPRELCYYLKVNRRPWPVMMGYFSKAITRYNAQAIHDATGLGDVIDDLVDERAVGFQMRGAERADMLTEYVVAVEKGFYKVPLIMSAYQAHRWCTVEDLYDSGQKFHLPDEVCAFALAEHLAQTAAPLAGPVEVTKGGEPVESFMVAEDEPEADRAAPTKVAQAYHKEWQDSRELSLTV